MGVSRAVPPARAIVHEWVHLGWAIPSIAGMSGAYRSRSRIPTVPRLRSAFARPSAMVDLPTPPLPAPTATTRRNGELAEEGLADLALGCGRPEDEHAVADLQLGVVVGMHELA